MMNLSLIPCFPKAVLLRIASDFSNLVRVGGSVQVLLFCSNQIHLLDKYYVKDYDPASRWIDHVPPLLGRLNMQSNFGESRHLTATEFFFITDFI